MDKEEIDKLNHWYSLLIKRLEGLEHSGRGDIIHDIGKWKGLINGWHGLMNKEIEHPLNLKPVEYYAKYLKNYLKYAEEFLLDMAKGD